MINTLVNHIGLEGVVDNPASGLFINSLAGITTKSIEALTEKEFENILQAWKRIESRAILLFEADLFPVISRITRSDSETVVNDYLADKLQKFELAFLYRLGIEFCKERLYSDRINRYTLMNQEKAEQLQEEFEAQYKRLLPVAVASLHPVVRKTVLP